MDQLNTKSFDLKPNPISSCIHNVWNCSWQQFEGYHYSNLEENDKYVSFRYSYAYGKSCSVRTLTPRGCNSARLARYKMEKLLHRVWMSSESNL